MYIVYNIGLFHMRSFCEFGVSRPRSLKQSRPAAGSVEAIRALLHMCVARPC